MISVEEFTQLLEKEFDDVEQGSLHPAMSYRDIPHFGSIHALVIIAFVDNQFDVLLSGEDLRNTQTIQDLYDLILTKKTA